VEEKERQERTLLRSTERKPAITVSGLNRAEDTELHAR
jgi:hypothetical protein